MFSRLARRLSILAMLFGAVMLASCGEDAKSTVTIPAAADEARESPPSLASCPVTQPPSPAFTPPAPVELPPRSFWYGSESLWTNLEVDGSWESLPTSASGLTQKLFWWSENYQWRTEPQPALLISGRRLDRSAPPLITSGATHALIGNDTWAAMLGGVSVPAAGCWEITGAYEGAMLTFVVLVAP